MWRQWTHGPLRYLLGAILFGLIVMGLRMLRPEPERFARTDSWYTGAPTEGYWEALPAAQVMPTTREMSAFSARELENAPFLEISYAAAEELTGMELTEDAELHPILIRSVQLSRYQHQVVVREDERGRLWVKSEAVSRWPLPMLQRPTVVLVRRLPRTLFVDADVVPSRSG